MFVRQEITEFVLGRMGVVSRHLDSLGYFHSWAISVFCHMYLAKIAVVRPIFGHALCSQDSLLSIYQDKRATLFHHLNIFNKIYTIHENSNFIKVIYLIIKIKYYFIGAFFEIYALNTLSKMKLPHNQSNGLFAWRHDPTAREQ